MLKFSLLSICFLLPVLACAQAGENDAGMLAGYLLHHGKSVSATNEQERTENSTQPARSRFEQWLLIIDPQKPGEIQARMRVKDWVKMLPAFELSSFGDFSPDGRWITFQGSNWVGVIDLQHQRLWWVFIPDVTYQHHPALHPDLGAYVWLPDSRTLLISVGSSDRHQLWTANVDGECRLLKDWVGIWGSTPDGSKLLLYADNRMWWATLESPHPE